MTTQADEVPFLSAMEREPVTGVFRADGALEALKKNIAKVNDVASQALDHAKALAMAVRSHDHGPNPDAPYAEVHARLNEIERLLDRKPGDYYERPNPSKGDSPWTDRIMSACAGLVLIGIPALIVMYGQLRAIETNQQNQQRQIDTLASIIEKIRK